MSDSNQAPRPCFYVGYSGRQGELERLLSCGTPIQAVYTGGILGKPANVHRLYLPSFELLAQQVHMCHQAGVQVEILVDASCFGAHHLWTRGQPLFVEYFRELEHAGVDGVIVSDPVLVELLKVHTGLRVIISSVSCVDSAFRARFYERLGADAIILDPVLNRQHTRLKQVVACLERAQPRLLLNEGCLANCPYKQFQWNLASHPDTPISADYYLSNCTAHWLEDPALILKSPTIRPEDLAAYRGLTSHFCLAPRLPRRAVTQDQVLQAYGRGRYDGEFLDLLADRGHPEIRNLDIPNRSLDGAWATRWHDCLSAGGCEGCDFCDELMARILGPAA